MYDEAIKHLTLVWELSEAKFGLKCETTASVFMELADAYSKKGEFGDAVEFQKRAFDIYQDLDSVDPKILGSIAIKLSEMYEQAEKIDEAIDALRKVSLSNAQAEKIYENSLGKMNKQTCKIKRNISLLMLKANKYQDALSELGAVEVFIILFQELEKNLYGEDSVKLGKTYKIIGTLHIITESPEEAKEYLTLAYKIFEAKGMDKLMKEVGGKLKMVNSPKNPKLYTNEEDPEGGDSKGKPSPSPVKLTKGKKKGKKKITKY